MFSVLIENNCSKLIISKAFVRTMRVS